MIINPTALHIDMIMIFVLSVWFVDKEAAEGSGLGLRSEGIEVFAGGVEVSGIANVNEVNPLTLGPAKHVISAFN